jgi:hypothetical protein
MRVLRSLMLVLALFVTTSKAPASELFPLSEPVGDLIHPTVDADDTVIYETGGKNGDVASRSDIWQVLDNQTSVKAQGQRNTCTVFSTTALLESLLLAAHPELKTIDLSEQWLQYLVALRSPTGGANGSMVTTNFEQIKRHGISLEDKMPYSGTLWSEKNIPADCQGLNALQLTRCLSSQAHPELLQTPDAELLNKSSRLFNPQFVEARKAAHEIRSTVGPRLLGGIVGSSSQIKSLLRRGIPLTIEINVFYGTWNHSAGTNFGIDIDRNYFTNGVVTYPEKGSLDAQISPRHLARHSVVIVGYDDNVEVSYKKKMADGTTQTFTRKGVYYFKNSWGKKFGGQFKLDRKRIPGFGMMTQDYAHQFGQFFAIDYNPGTAL